MIPTTYKMDRIIEQIISSVYAEEEHMLTARIIHFPEIFMKAASQLTGDTALRVLLDDLSIRKYAGELQGEDEQAQFQYYNEILLQDKAYINQLLEKYPELDRLLQLQLGQLLDVMEQIADRLEKDRTRIRKELCQGKDFERIADLELLISDPHNHGKRAARVTLDNGIVIYYKPHTIEKSLKYQKVCHYISECLGMGFQKTGYIDCGDYGWEACIEQKPCKTEAEVKRYYIRMGNHLFLAYALSATDLHGENLIAHGEYPVIVDFETFPGTTAWIESTSAERKAAEIIENSVLRTGILPVLTWGKGKQAVVTSALSNGQKVTTPFRMAVVKEAGTSNAHIEYEHLQVNMPGCIVKLGNATVNPADYVEEICDGFQKAYQIFLKDGVVKQMLEPFFDGKSRVVLRHTQQYFMYRFTSLHQDFCKDMEDRRDLLSVLYEKEEDEISHKIHTYEMESLLRLDIPYFEVAGRSRSLYDGDGGEYESYFSHSPFEAWNRKISEFGEADLERQLIILRLSLELLRPVDQVAERQSVCLGMEGSCENLPIDGESGKNLDSLSDMAKSLENAAGKIIDWIARTAIATKEDINWLGIQFYSDEKWSIKPLGMYLYDGVAGIALFLAEYTKNFRHEKAVYLLELLKKKMFRYTDKVRLDFMDLDRKGQEIPGNYRTGLLDGEGSLVQAYVLLYRITGDMEFLSYAQKHFEVVEMIAQQDQYYDYLSGNAGTIINAAGLFELTGKREYREFAVQTEKNLWSHAVKMKVGYGYKTAGDHAPLAGIAHGNSGFLMAYAKLIELAGDNGYSEKANELLLYEDSLYSEEKGNWFDLRREEQEKVMNAWCHGAPGILLSRLQLSKVMDSEIVIGDIKRAAEALFVQKPGNHICLCHGIAGNLLIMNDYLKEYDNRGYRERYYNMLQGFLQNLDAAGMQIPLEYLNPAFMNGISGVGMALIQIYKNDWLQAHE